MTTVTVLPTFNGGLGFTTAATGSLLSMLNLTTVTTIVGNGTASIVGFSNATTATAFPVGQIPGVATAAVVATGNIGEYMYTSRSIASAIALTNETATTVISLPLTAGNWEVYCLVGFTGQTGTLVRYAAGSLANSSTVLNTSTIGNFVSIPGFNLAMFTSTTLLNTPAIGFPVVRQLLATSTTVFLTAQMNFTVSTASAFGSITAIRR
jgi:hypothetical protein